MTGFLRTWFIGKLIFIAVCTIFAIGATRPVSAGPLGTKENPVRMMFVPSGEAQVILKGGQKIGLMLQDVTGLYFKTSIATSYAAVIEAMGAGKVDIGWLATFSYVLGKKKYGFDLLLIVVRIGSPF